jgi:hypothetical protein
MQRVLGLCAGEGGVLADMRQDCSSACVLVTEALTQLQAAHQGLRKSLGRIAPLFWGVVQHAFNLQVEIDTRMSVSRHVLGA